MVAGGWSLPADFRAAMRSTPEVELARQLAEAREAAKAADERAARAAKAKQGYKEQVRRVGQPTCGYLLVCAGKGFSHPHSACNVHARAEAPGHGRASQWPCRQFGCVICKCRTHCHHCSPEYFSP